MTTTTIALQNNDGGEDSTNNQPSSTLTSNSFDLACQHVKSLHGLSNDQMLQLYALFKQATIGFCTSATAPKPPFWDFTAKAKWQSWRDLGEVGSDEAKSRYVALVHTLDPTWDENAVKSYGQKDGNTTKKTKSQGLSSFGVSVSTMARSDDDNVEDFQKTLFDWCREERLDKIKELVGNDELITDDDHNMTDWAILSANSNNHSISPRTHVLNEGGMNLLHCAADLGHYGIVEYLIHDLSFDVNSADADGQCALHYAAACSHVEVMRLLLGTGAVDVTLKDMDGLTALDVAEDEEVKKMLLDVLENKGN